MKFKPHKYQAYAIEHILKNPVSALFLDMGLGKTVITLTALWDLMCDSLLIRKCLIIAPLRVARDTWSAEFEKWDHLKGLTYSVAVGSDKDRRKAFARNACCYIINRENVDWLIDSGIDLDFDMVVIDELSSFKSHRARRFKALLKMRPGLARIVGLTGTPCSNGLMDLWAQFRILDMGARLGRFIGRFREAYFKPDYGNGIIVYSYSLREGAEEQIYEKIKDITVSMKGCDHLELPELVSVSVPVKMPEAARIAYQNFKRDLVLAEPNVTAANAAALSVKLQQFAGGSIYADASTDSVDQAFEFSFRHEDDRGRGFYNVHSEKVSALEDLIEAANGKPVLVAYWFKHELTRLEAFGHGVAARRLESAKDICDWNAGEIPIALIHPASAGHGLNLQAGGSTLIWYSLPWSLELYQQTNARLHRQGQKNTVTIHHIITEGTIDERVMAALECKKTTQSALIDAVKAEWEGFG